MFRAFLVAAAVAAMVAPAQGQTLRQMTHPAPDGAELALQMTGGRVLVQGDNNSDWWVLTPNAKGQYLYGTWKQVASLPSGYSPYAMASQVLADGRVLIEGGEYSFNQFTLTNKGAIYDPTKNTWTMVSPPRGWTNIGDSPSVVLPHGFFALGNKLNMAASMLDPSTMAWRPLKTVGKHDFNAEEGWTLLPDGSLLTVDVKDNPASERFIPSQGKWVGAGSTIVNLQGPPCCGCTRYPPRNKCYYPPGEVGPALLMPNGTVFATGATHQGETTAHTAIYSPSSNSWKAGPDFPNGDQAGDDFAALLPNGHALVEANSGTLYEFDGTSLKAEPFNLGNGGGVSLMVLPSGGVLVGGYAIYSGAGTYEDAWRPTITDCPATVTRGSSYMISGTQFNGLSQANAFGDELQSSTNFPLVRITNNSSKDVFYARTHDHSSMAVATGSAMVSTTFDVPTGTQTGASSLVVIANGIPSVPVSITVK